jgi:hypothetical protein
VKWVRLLIETGLQSRGPGLRVGAPRARKGSDSWVGGKVAKTDPPKVATWEAEMLYCLGVQKKKGYSGRGSNVGGDLSCETCSPTT